ncbi:MAG: dihydropteroate synthase [Congregibacter sp.]
MDFSPLGAVLDCAGRRLDLSAPVIMGVLNITPDSFSDGGVFLNDDRGLKKGQGSKGCCTDIDRVRRAAASMVEAGAAILDVGGESTRPGAAPVSVQEELDRVLPVVEILARECDAVVSLDTSTPAVMSAGAALGAGLINDVRALGRENALDTAAALGLPVCLMHMRGSPDTMQHDPQYADVVGEVRAFLGERAQACLSAGFAESQIVLDPGFGFGKSVEHNLCLLRDLPRLADLGFPLIVGLSRKSLIAKLTGRAVDERLPGSLAFALLAAQRGAAVLRVHDVAETADVLRILQAVQEYEKK